MGGEVALLAGQGDGRGVGVVGDILEKIFLEEEIFLVEDNGRMEKFGEFGGRKGRKEKEKGKENEKGKIFSWKKK